jgi:hypothetical protein
MRDQWLTCDDSTLLAQCHVDTYRASGPGGQKRNKTSSAVRLRHRPSGLIAIAEESRSQHENKARALRRIRMVIALNVRTPVGEKWQGYEIIAGHVDRVGRLVVSAKRAEYAEVVAHVLDMLESSGGRVADAAKRLELTTGQLSKFITADGKVMEAVNRMRRERGMAIIRNNE